MARKTTTNRPNRLTSAFEERPAPIGRWDENDDEADIRFSLTALGEAVVGERDKRSPKFRGFGPCGRIVA